MTSDQAKPLNSVLHPQDAAGLGIAKTESARNDLLERLAHAFYEEVDPKYRTCCVFTSQIIQTTLRHFQIPSTLEPCQIWYVQPTHIYVIGFLGKVVPGKWDGHVVCSVGDVLIDAATHHFESEFGLAVPWVVMTSRFTFPTPSLAHTSINATDALWWQPPPEQANTQLPEEPQELVASCAQKLIDRLVSAVR